MGQSGMVPPRRRGRPRGRTEQGEHTRRHVYEVAIRLIATRGWQQTTLRDVAREAGVSVGLLYRYFPSKQAVVLERVDADGGQVKLNGEVWTARSYDHDRSFEAGERVEVLKIDGATALVHE